MITAETTRSNRKLHVRKVRRHSEHVAAYRLRYQWPSHDTDPRGSWLIHARRLVMDPWDIRDAVGFLACRGQQPVGTLRLVHRRRCALLEGCGAPWRVLAGRLGVGPRQAITASAIVSRVAIEGAEVEAGFALHALLLKHEQEARQRGLKVLVARVAESNSAMRRAFDSAGFELLDGELRYKLLGALQPEAGATRNGSRQSSATLQPSADRVTCGAWTVITGGAEPSDVHVPLVERPDYVQ